MEQEKFFAYLQDVIENATARLIAEAKAKMQR